jgi:hypothetical protein
MKTESLELGTKILHIRKDEKLNAAIKNLRVLVTLTFMLALLPTMAWAQHYTQTNLVSNLSGVAPITDPNLQNAWGLVHSPTSPWWVSNNAGGTSTLYSINLTQLAELTSSPWLSPSPMLPASRLPGHRLA